MSTRRDFLALMLGAPLAYACRGTGPRPLPPGSIIDTGMVRGHRLLRDGAAAVTGATARRRRVVVVGGGVAGLAAAWQLRRQQVTDVLVLELDSVTGGTSRGGSSPVTRHPWGAHYVVAPQREQTELVALLGEMNAIEGYQDDGTPIVDETLRCREPEERVWYMGKWWDGLYLEAGASAEDKRQLAVFNAEIDRWSAWRDGQGRRAFIIPRSLGSDDAEVTALDAVSFAQWLDERGLSSPRLRWLCDYACRDDYALTAAQTSAWAGLFYFAGRQSAPGAEAQSVITWPDGNGAMVRHLADGAQIRTGVVVVDIVERDGLVRVSGFDDGGPIAIDADAVIVATPTFVADRIVGARRDAPSQESGEYGAWAVANVHLRGRPLERGGGAPPSWDNVFRDSPSLGYVSATHQRGRDRGPTVWTWYFPFTDEDTRAVREKIAGAGQPEWAEVVLADLARAHPDVRDHVERLDVAFWGHGMIRPRVGTVWSERLRAAARPIGRIHFAHTDLSGYALFEEAFDHGLRAARAVARGLAA
jgi:phytoene dehydrogenase-like protein